MAHTGTVKFFNDAKGYGLIARSEGPDVYVHHSQIRMEGYRTLKPGARVVFEVEDGPDGPRARQVGLAEGFAPSMSAPLDLPK